MQHYNFKNYDKYISKSVKKKGETNVTVTWYLVK